jgi:hypothetical protein
MRQLTMSKPLRAGAREVESLRAAEISVLPI